MRRRTFLKLTAASASLAALGTSGCGSGSGGGPPLTVFRVDARRLTYDLQNGNAYEWVPNQHLVRALGSSGQTLWVYQSSATSRPLNYPSGIELANGRLYVSDMGNSRIVVLNAGGQYLFEFGISGSDPGKFRFVQEITADAAGNLYICDALNHRIQVTTGEGVLLRTFGKQGTSGYDLNYPESVAFDQNGSLYVADSGNRRMVVFAPDGTGLRTFGKRGTGPGEMLDPEGIAVDRWGRVYVADKAMYVIHVFDPNGQFIERVRPRFDDGSYAVPLELTWRPDGALHVSAEKDASTGKVGEQYGI